MPDRSKSWMYSALQLLGGSLVAMALIYLGMSLEKGIDIWSLQTSIFGFVPGIALLVMAGRD